MSTVTEQYRTTIYSPKQAMLIFQIQKPRKTSNKILHVNKIEEESVPTTVAVDDECEPPPAKKIALDREVNELYIIIIIIIIIF